MVAWSDRFQAYKSVAPLKRCGGCGGCALAFCCFHAYKSVAPLKRLLTRTIPAIVSAFPRLQKRGPIEAISGAKAPSEANGFHAYKSVAPLKHDSDRRTPCDACLVSTLTKAWLH